MSDRKPMMAGNWKMNHNHLEAIQVVQKLGFRLDQKDYDRVDVVVCPPFTALRSVQTTIDGDRLQIGLGAQNCHWEPSGAYTGEISPLMLAKLNVKHVIVGHSERRELFGETDEMVSMKLRAVLGAGMAPILCVGETLDEREQGATDAKVKGQIESAFARLPIEDAARCTVAYEPIWRSGRAERESRRREYDDRRDPRAHPGGPRRRVGRGAAHPLRRQRQARQRRRADGDARDRRRPRRRQLSRPRRLRPNRPVRGRLTNHGLGRA